MNVVPGSVLEDGATQVLPSRVACSWRLRAAALGVLLVLAAFFLLALSLTPVEAGYGTHRQLGFPACLMPLLTGYPCPTCGMTTAMAFAARGRFLASFHAQPAGLAIFIAIVVLAFGCLRVLALGNLQFLRIQIGAAKIAFLVVAVLLFGWAYKIMTFTP